MAFISTSISSCYHTTNDQLRTSSNPRNQATIQDGRVTMQHVQGRQSQSFAGNRSQSNAISIGVNRIIGVALDEEQLAFLADPRVAQGQDTQTTLPAAFQTDDLVAFDSDCHEAPSARAVLMTNLSSYDSDVISELPISDTFQDNTMLDHCVQEMYYSEQPAFDHTLDIEIKSDSNIISYDQYMKKNESKVVQDTTSHKQQNAMIMSVIDKMSNQVTKCNDVNLENKNVNESLTVELERYKEQIKINAKFTAFENEIHTIKLHLYKNIEDNKTLTTTMDVLKKETKEKEGKYLEEIVDLEKKKKDVDNIVYKVVPVKPVVPRKLPSKSLVKQNLQKFKSHLDSFDKVVKVRTKVTAQNEGTRGFEHIRKAFEQDVIPFMKYLQETFQVFDKGLHIELNEMKAVFNQMEYEVEQCYADKKCFEIKKKELFLEND
ncbi:hypothetical protein Tco_1351298 [Tanacetum coccineum]